MRINILLLSILLVQQLSGQSWPRIHQKGILVDTHNDILMKSTNDSISNNAEFAFDKNLAGKTHSDLARWKEGGLDVQVFSVYCDGHMPHPFHFANRQLDTLDAVIARNPGLIVKVSNSVELMKVVKEHKIAAMAGVEGGHMIEDNINNLDALYKRGVRYMTLTWNNSTAWASSAWDETFT